MGRILIVTFVLFVLLQGMGIAHGSFISMETKIVSKFQENSLVVEVGVTNNGDEPAYSVQVSIDADDKVATTPVKEILRIKENYKVSTSFDMDIQMVGRYPLIVTVDYTDLNQYPFSAISSSYFVYKEDVGPKIHGKIDEIGISKGGRLVLTIKNLLDTGKKIRVKLVAPRELSVAEAVKEVDIDSKSEEEIRFDIKNFSALSGSSYQVLATMQYEDNEKHCTVTIPGIIKIMERKDIFNAYKWLFIGIGVVLLVVFLGLQFGLPFLKRE